MSNDPSPDKPGQRAAGEQHLDLGEVVRLLRRRRWAILATVGLLTGLTALIVFLLPPQYTAVATVLVEGPDPQVLPTEAVTNTPRQDRPMIATHIQLLTARAFMRGVVDAAALDRDPEFNPALPGGPRPSDWLEDALARLAASAPMRAVLAEGAAPGGPRALPLEQQKEQTIDQLLLQTKAEQAGEAYTIAIRVTAHDPDKAARLANLMAERYVARQLEARRQATERAIGFLSARLDELRGRVARTDDAVAAYLQEKGLTQAREDNPLLRQLDQLSVQLVQAQARRVQAEARRQQVQRPTAREENQGTAGLFTSPLLLELRQQAALLDRKAAELATIYGRRHPQMNNLQAEIDSVRLREREEMARIMRDLDDEVQAARAGEGQLRARLAELETQARRQQHDSVPLRALEREADIDKTIYTTFLSRFKDVSEQLDLVVPGVSLVSAAQPPGVPSFPHKTLLISGSFGGSLVLGLVVAFVAELLDSGLRSARQVESALGLPALALVPRVGRRQLGGRPLHRYLAANPCSGFANAVRGLKVELLQSNLDRPPKVVLVTSALPGEGKTSLALCLAALAAKDGAKVALVDLDLHRPRLRRLLGVAPERPGVVELLSEEAALDEALAADPEVPGLVSLTVRRQAANPSALFATRRMAVLIAELTARFELVVLDTPPALAVSDSRALAGHADTLLYVVRWGATRAEAGRAGLERLREAPITVAGAVLNQVDIRRHAKRAYGDALQYYRRYAKYYKD